MPDVTQILSRIESGELPSRGRITALLAVALCCCLSCSDHSTYKPIATFALPEYRDLVAVPVTIHGTDHLLILDTGSTKIFFHTTLRGELGNVLERVRTQTPLGEKPRDEIFVCPTVRLGGLDLPKTELVVCDDESGLCAATGRDVEGIIGMPWFRTVIVQFDFDHNEMRVLPPDTPPSRTWGQAIAVDRDERGFATIRVRIGPNDAQAIIDTGCTGEISLSDELYGELLEGNLIRAKSDVPASDSTGVHRIHRGTLSEVELAGFHHRDVDVTSGGPFTAIGLEYFRRYLVTMDFPRSTIYLKKGARFDEPAPWSESGIGLLRLHEKTIVSDVITNSEAARAGTLVDDELEAVNGEAVSGKPIAEIFWMMEKCKLKSDAPVLLTVRRNGEVRDIKVARGHASEAPSGE